MLADVRLWRGGGGARPEWQKETRGGMGRTLVVQCLNAARRTLGPKIATKAIAAAPAATINGQFLRIAIGSAGGPQGINVPRFSQLVLHINPEVPPKVDAAAEIRIRIIPCGLKAPAMHIKIPPAKYGIAESRTARW